MSGQQTPEGLKQTDIGLIAADWALEPLSFLTEIIGGFAFNSKKFRPSGDYQIIKMSNLYGGSLNLQRSKDFLTELSDIERKFILKNGEILLTLTGTTGKRDYGFAAIINNEKNLLVNQRVALLRAKNSNNPWYLMYQLKSPCFLEQFFGISKGGTGNQTNIGTSDIANLLIPTPSYSEQTAIANTLSDVDALIQELEKLIAKKQAIKTATMQQLLTGRTRLPQFAHHPDGRKKGYKPSELGEIPEDWEVKPLLDIATLIHGKAHEPYVHELGNFVVVNSKFVSTSGETRKFCTKNECVAKKGDVLMVLSDLPNGKALAKCYLTEQDNIYAVNQRVCIFRTSTFNPKYLHLILNRHKYFLSLDDGVTQTHILNGDISSCLLVVPEDELERTSIADMVTDIESEIQSLEQRLSKTRQIKQGMMQELLTGKTRLVKPAGAA